MVPHTFLRSLRCHCIYTQIQSSYQLILEIRMLVEPAQCVPLCHQGVLLKKEKFEQRVKQTNCTT